MINPFQTRRSALGAARRLLLGDAESIGEKFFDPPRLTPQAIQRTRMSRSRAAILTNLEEMYREAFERAEAAGDDTQKISLDFAFRREQLYFEILLDVRDALERR
jgi:hypothetical protein